MSYDLNGWVDLATGGSTVIGRATALAYAGAGAYVAVFDVDDAEGEETVWQTHEGRRRDDLRSRRRLSRG